MKYLFPLVFLLTACGERVDRPMDLSTYKQEMEMCLKNATGKGSDAVYQCRVYAEDVAERAVTGAPQ